MTKVAGWMAIVGLAVAVVAGCSFGGSSNDQPATPSGAAGAADGGKAPAAGDYPLAVCVVSGEELGSMGDPFIHTHEGREVRLCCKKCLDKFNAEPGKYLAKLDEAAKKK